MSWTTIGGVSDERVDAVATGSNAQVTIGSLPNVVGLMLPRALAERLHATLGEARVITWHGRPLCPGHSADESDLRGYKPRPRERGATA
jgi:hypothetical protein